MRNQPRLPRGCIATKSKRREFAAPENAAVWAIEIERRVGAYDRGELPAVDRGEALDHIRQAVADFRAQGGFLNVRMVPQSA